MIWPAPDRSRVQATAQPTSEGGQLLTGSREVIWGPRHVEQMKAGDIVLHDPTPTPEVMKDAG